MLRIATLLVAAALAAGAPSPVSNVLKVDLEPADAQRYIDNPPFADPQLAGRTAILPLIRYDDPRFRSAEAGPTLGHYWRNGHEIEDPENYQEEVYDAAQYHGQSGLGDYAYGYRTPESAKVEDRAGSGNVKGSYVYKDSNNDLIQVRYWADSQGFHQEDNIPKVELKPVEETEEVRAARLEHERAWQLARAASLHAPLPQEYEAVPAASELQSSVLQAPEQAPLQQQGARDAKALPYAQQQYYTTTTTEEPEPTGPPRGFFYSFTYPVSIIVPKEAAYVPKNNQEAAYLAAHGKLR
ncbi:uncharacterized protein [Battus philenor]|uniref:uncharacterized protein n=1 Tax=Battus philenor TaxID=42288 RepID=UPI0035D0DD91